jgi:protein SCO1/2
MHADPALWQFAGVPDVAQRQALLATFGITVIPAPLGEFQHNAAFHVVTADGRLARVVDYDAPQQALQCALASAAALPRAASAVQSAASEPRS